MSSWLRGIFIATLVLAGLSLFILAATSTDSTLFERWFPVLLVINRAIAVVLFAVVAAMAVRSGTCTDSLRPYLLCFLCLHFTLHQFLVRRTRGKGA